MQLKLLYVSAPSKQSGGSLRSLMSLKYLGEYDIEPYLITYKRYIKNVREENLNIDLVGSIDFIQKIDVLKYTLLTKTSEYLYACRKCAEKVAREIIKNYGKDHFDAVYCHHENFKLIIFSYYLSNLLRIPKIALLCLPPFYNDDRIPKLNFYFNNIIYSNKTLKRISKKITIMSLNKMKNNIEKNTKKV